MKYFIASDHAGFELKNYLTKEIKDLKDLGPKEFIIEDDYPDYVYILTSNLKKDINNSKGILICKNGVGVCLAANKFKQIRAGLTFSSEHSKTLVSDDNINILCLPADFISKEEAIKIVKNFMEVKFTPENRHLRRLKKVSIIENSNL